MDEYIRMIKWEKMRLRKKGKLRLSCGKHDFACTISRHKMNMHAGFFKKPNLEFGKKKIIEARLGETKAMLRLGVTRSI